MTRRLAKAVPAFESAPEQRDNFTSPSLRWDSSRSDIKGQRRVLSPMKRVCDGLRRHLGIHRLAVCAFVALGSTLIVAAAFAQANLSGRWDLMMDPDFAGNQTTQHCQMKQENRKLTVTCGARPGAAMVGDVNGKSVVWKFVSTGVTPGGWTAAWSGDSTTRLRTSKERGCSHTRTAIKCADTLRLRGGLTDPLRRLAGC